MNQEIKLRWVEALRSGEYQQGTGSLCTVAPGGEKLYCCLGVLCEVLDAPRLSDLAGFSMVQYKDTGTSDRVQTSLLPQQIADKAELSSCPEVLYRGEVMTLIGLNDVEQLSFLKIADLIEAQL